MTHEASDTRHPPLLALPSEIKLHIIDYLSHDIVPCLAILRRTHSTLLDVIPKARLRSEFTTRQLRRQLLYIKNYCKWLLPEDHIPCQSAFRRGDVASVWEWWQSQCFREGD